MRSKKHLPHISSLGDQLLIGYAFLKCFFSLKLTCVTQPDTEKGEHVGVRGLHEIIALSQYSVFLLIYL